MPLPPLHGRNPLLLHLPFNKTGTGDLPAPDPEILPHPDRCVFLDDTKANVEAAEQAGIHGIHFMGYEDGVAQLKNWAFFKKQAAAFVRQPVF